MKVAERSRIDLPDHVPDEFEVFVGGVRQARGSDYEVEGRVARLPAADRPGGTPRLLALASDVARRRRQLPQARDRRSRLRARRAPAGRDRPYSRSRTSQTEAAASSGCAHAVFEERGHGIGEHVPNAARTTGGSRRRRSPRATTNAVRGRQQVDSDEVGAHRLRRGECQRPARAAAARPARPAPPSAAFVRHSPLRGDRGMLRRRRGRPRRRRADPSRPARRAPARARRARGTTASAAAGRAPRRARPAVVQRSTSRPQLPKRGLSTTGSSGAGAGSARADAA